MIIKQCDLCSNEVNDLTLLTKELQTYEIKEICNSCFINVSKMNTNLIIKYAKIRQKEMKQYLAGYKNRL